MKCDDKCLPVRLVFAVAGGAVQMKFDDKTRPHVTETRAQLGAG